MAVTKRRADGVERVYDHVKAMAMDFSFDPGQKVKEGELAAELGVSRIPVREALNRLVAEGFVTFVPNRGFFCRGIDLAEIDEIYAVRAALEMWAFRTACKTAAQDALDAFCGRWARPEITGEFRSLNRYDAEFHSKMAALAGNTSLLRQLRQIEEKIAAFRNLELVDADRRAKTLGEHGQIVSLLANRQGEAGALFLERHILSSARNAIAAARQRLGRRAEASAP